MNEIPVSEAQIKKAVEDWLQLQDNLGNLTLIRLNAGEFIETRGGSRRRIKGAPKGAADYEVLQAYEGDAPICIVSFIEIKRPSGGKQSQAQKEFAEKVTKFHANYYLVTSVEELMEVLR